MKLYYLNHTCIEQIKAFSVRLLYRKIKTYKHTYRAQATLRRTKVAALLKYQNKRFNKRAMMAMDRSPEKT